MLPRLLPDVKLPSYSYVPGFHPRPTEEAPLVERLPESWKDSREYCFGIDLFHYGFYWEAHEYWEQLWHAAGRKGKLADFFKALIRIAAAGVKLRALNPRGAILHAARVEELVGSLGNEEIWGVRPERLREVAAEVRNFVSRSDINPKLDVQRLFVTRLL